MTSNKPDRRNIFVWMIKVSFLVLALIVAYLFALNGRYTHIGGDEFFDKWTKTILVIDKFNEIR